MKKSLKDIKKKGWEYFYLTIFKFLYLAGLTFIIPFVLSVDAPSEIGMWRGTQEALLVISVFLIGFSAYGVYTQKDCRVDKTLRAMSWMTLIPGVISLSFGIFGKGILTSFALYMQNLEELTPLVETAINHTVNRVWYLTMSFIIIGLALYYLSKQMK